MAKANPSQLRLWSDVECQLWSGETEKKPTKKPNKNYAVEMSSEPTKRDWAWCLTPDCREFRARPATHCRTCMERFKRISDRVKANRKTAKLTPVELRGLNVRV